MPLTSRALLLAAALAVLAVAGCIRLISAEQLEDGSAVMCVRLEPTQDAGVGSDAGAAPPGRYVPLHAPVAAPASSSEAAP